MPVVTFLSDYGFRNEFVGVCHGVIATICPEARIIDVTHGVPRHDVQAGALALAGALPYLPAGVHLAVVDPEVGSERRAVALRAGERLFVGPDNGLLSVAAERAGGVVEAVEITHSPWRLEPVSATFHGRDILAPVAGRLAAGAALAEAGEPLDASELVTLELPRPRREDGELVAHALLVDAFGNVQLDAAHDDLAGTGLKLGRPVRVRTGGGARTAQYALTFAAVEPGALLVYENAQRHLALGVNRGDAARELGLGPGAEVRLAPA